MYYVEIRVRNLPLCSSISLKDVFLCINACDLVDDEEVTVKACADIGGVVGAKSEFARCSHYSNLSVVVMSTDLRGGMDLAVLPSCSAKSVSRN